MAVVIRLQRHGAKKNPYYRIVAVNSRERRDTGNVLAVIGKYDPMQPKDSDRRVVFDADKAKSWLAKGAKASDRVYRFFAAANLLPKREYPDQPKKSAPSEKTLAKLKAREEKLAKTNEAAAAPTEAAIEAPAETPAVETTPATEAPATEAAPTTETPAEAPAAETTPTIEPAAEPAPVGTPAAESALETPAEAQ